MGLGAGKSFNPHKKQRKEILKGIDADVNNFMKDFEEHKSHALASVDDLLSSASGATVDSKI